MSAAKRFSEAVREMTDILQTFSDAMYASTPCPCGAVVSYRWDRRTERIVAQHGDNLEAVSFWHYLADIWGMEDARHYSPAFMDWLAAVHAHQGKEGKLMVKCPGCGRDKQLPIRRRAA